jgi:excisionase family DNA binding protein
MNSDAIEPDGNGSHTEAPDHQPAPSPALASPEYLTKAQVARLLGVSTRTIDNMMRQRRIPFVKLSSKIVRFPRAEVHDYIRRNLTIKARGQDNGA